MPFATLFAAAMPSLAWAALLMAAFVGVSVFTMLLTRYPVRRAPPAVLRRPEAGEKEQPPRADG